MQLELDAQEIIGSLQRQNAELSYKLAVAEAQIAALSQDQAEEATESPNSEEAE